MKLGSAVKYAFEMPPPIGLQRPASLSPSKHESLTIKLRSDPADPTSQTYNLSVKIFQTGTPEEWLLFVCDLQKVMTGQNITTGPTKYAMARRLMAGDAKTVFDGAAATHGNKTVANFDLCLRDVTTHVFPQRALICQKRFMRNNMRKPRDLSTRMYAAQLTDINA